MGFTGLALFEKNITLSSSGLLPEKKAQKKKVKTLLLRFHKPQKKSPKRAQIEKKSKNSSQKKQQTTQKGALPSFPIFPKEWIEFFLLLFLSSLRRF